MSLKIETEIKLESDPCVLAWDGQLFVGTEDGNIKSFDSKLTPKESWQAHGVQLFALASGNGYLYSSSNDGGIRVWSHTGQKVSELPPTGADVLTIHVFDKQVCAGDEAGNIVIYENNDMKATYNVLEEIKDLWYDPPYLFTVRDSYITVTEIKPEHSKTRFMTRHNIEGRTPLWITGNRLVFVSRSGYDLCLHDSSIKTEFEKLHEVKVSDLIVTTLVANGNKIWTGGWDGIVRKWQINGNKLEAAGEINLGGCINSLATADDTVYAAVSGGKVQVTFQDHGNHIYEEKHSKTRFMTRHNIEGRTPLWITGNRLVFVSRSGYDLCLHDSSIKTEFEKLHEVKVSDLIVTTLVANGNKIWTGGWDGIVRKWQINGNKLEAAGEINLGGCINSLATADDTVYAAVSGGKVVHVA